MNDVELDELGIRIRLGLDPQMRMEGEGEGSGEGGSEGSPGEGEGGSEGIGTGEGEGSTADPFEDAKVEQFDRKYVEKLREENAKYRTRAQTFESTFKEWPQESVDGFLNLAKAIESGDTAAVPVLEQLLQGLTPAEQKALADAAGEEAKTTEETPKYMTPEEVEAYIEKRDADKAAAADKTKQETEQLDALRTELSELGYDTEKANPDAALLFHFAQTQEGEGVKDFKKADAEVKAFKQAAIDEYVGRIAGRKSKFARVAAGSGGAPAGEDGGNKNLGLSNGNSKRAMDAFLDAQFAD